MHILVDWLSEVLSQPWVSCGFESKPRVAQLEDREPALEIVRILSAAGMSKWEIPFDLAFMKIFAREIASICLLAVCASPPVATAQAATIRVQSSLVLVDVFSQDHKSGLPIRDFKKEDVRLFDNRHEVRIATF